MLENTEADATLGMGCQLSSQDSAEMTPSMETLKLHVAFLTTTTYLSCSHSTLTGIKCLVRITHALSALSMLAMGIITGSKQSFPDATESRIIYKNNPRGIFSPFLADQEAGLPSRILMSILMLPLFF